MEVCQFFFFFFNVACSVPWLLANTTASNGFLIFSINILFFLCNLVLVSRWIIWGNKVFKFIVNDILVYMGWFLNIIGMIGNFFFYFIYFYIKVDHLYSYFQGKTRTSVIFFYSKILVFDCGFSLLDTARLSYISRDIVSWK